MLWWFAQTSLIAGGLAVVATLGGRWKRLGPEARHALWLLVLIKLAVPPIIAWPWGLPDSWPARPELAAAPAIVPAVVEPAPASLPEPGPVEPVEPIDLAEVAPATRPDDPISTPDEPRTVEPPAPVEPPPLVAESRISDRKSSIWPWEAGLGLAWLLGSVVVVLRRWSRVFAFHRGLAEARPAPAWLVEETRVLGERVGVNPPPVVATRRVATPLLWCLGRPRLVLPEALIGRLKADRWPGILAHELAHLARGDHWVVRLELLVEAAWWWNPLFWLARRRLHEQAEIACDARVVRSLPDRRFAYAEALVEVCEHIARAAIPSPSLGVGGGGSGAAHSLEGRLHMILRDPIPRRSGRRAAWLAASLAALALPSWTLGQQPDPAKPKPDAPPSAPAAPSPGAAAPADAPRSVPALITIEAIIAAQAEARNGLGNLAFRYAVASRDLSRAYVLPAGLGPQAVAPVAGSAGAVRADRITYPIRHVQAVHVQAADVILGDRNGTSRLDVVEARPTPKGVPLAWDRRFVVDDGEVTTSLEVAHDATGPVPFRRLARESRSSAFGDSFLATFHANAALAVDPDRGIDPLDPRPGNINDFSPPHLPYLNPDFARAEVVGLETINGREVVRVAWTSRLDSDLRGLCWLAPELGYAVVRFDATKDPRRSEVVNSKGRRTWRKRSSDFVKVASLWLPRKVSWEESQADYHAEGNPVLRREREMTFEDYRVVPPAVDLFRPRLAVQAIDDRSGHFITNPPEVPAGLVDRLARAVAESPFGPPEIQETIEGPPQVGVRNYIGIVTNIDEATGRVTVEMPKQAAKPGEPAAELAQADPKVIAQPGLDFAANQRMIDEMVKRRFQLDPEVVALKAQMLEARNKLAEAERLAALPGDLNLVKAKRKLDQYMQRWNQIWDEKSLKIREGLEQDAQTRDDIEVLQARRDGKAAELEKAAAGRDLAALELTYTEKLSAKKSVSPNEVAMYQGKLKVATAEFSSKQAGLAEADAFLNQAKRRLGLAKAEDPAPDPVARPARPPVTEEPKDADREAQAQDARDEVAVRQARRDGKASELGKAQARCDLAMLFVARNAKLKAKAPNLVSNEEAAKAEAELKVAEAERAGTQAELAEADIYLDQARRRAGRRPSPTSASEPIAPLTELRDAIELREVRLQGKQAELRGEDIQVNRLKASLASMKANGLELQDSYREAASDVEVAQSHRDVKTAEVLESEIQLKQARRRLEASEARLKRDAARLKDRLDWSEGMFKKGYVSKATYDADKAAYDELMIQLDPKYVPAPPAEAPPKKD